MTNTLLHESGIPYPEKNHIVMSKENASMDEILESIGIDYSNNETWLAALGTKGTWHESETSVELIKSNDEIYICLVITDIDEDQCSLIHIRNVYPFTSEGLRMALKMQEACS